MVHVRLFRLPVCGRLANVVADAGQELLDLFASSNAILAEREEASLQTDVGPTGVGFAISLSTFYTVGFCPLFMLWDSVLWDFVLWDFVLWDFVLQVGFCPDTKQNILDCIIMLTILTWFS